MIKSREEDQRLTVRDVSLPGAMNRRGRNRRSYRRVSASASPSRSRCPRASSGADPPATDDIRFGELPRRAHGMARIHVIRDIIYAHYPPFHNDLRY